MRDPIRLPGMPIGAGSRGMLLCAALLAPCAPAQAAQVDLFAPRPFGYFLGDLIAQDAIITLDPGYRLEESALPRPRSVTYWLDLRAARLAELPEKDGARRYRLTLTYQSFYAPLEPRALDIPAVALMARDGARTLALTVPAWTFVASPLREIVASRAANPMALRPDIAPAPHPLAADLRRAAGAAVVALASFAGLARLRGWGPFGRRRLPFAAAAREMARARPGQAPAEIYEQALLHLHRAFDASAGRRLLADDVPAFLAAAPHFGGAAGDIARFFAASRVAFFGAGARAAMAALPPEALAPLARRLATAERSGRGRPAPAEAAA